MQGLQAKQHTGKYELSLVRPPAVADIDAIDFIEQVEQVDSNSFIVYTTSPADELAAIAVNNNWGLIKLVPHEHSLEQIFVNLTLGDGADA
jgi:hypothetical protein